MFCPVKCNIQPKHPGQFSILQRLVMIIEMGVENENKYSCTGKIIDGILLAELLISLFISISPKQTTIFTSTA